ncbi:Sec-independent protein translocase subunit TatA [Epidermidibacterium keratini]|uniref:Sec-independent protein translocase protein TatA n=1 Tax=Epidermidibacterium keratini TaxID=1891644 RepID=A0A7L4YSI1_9ACTN|nr:Sec-independent protein translocase subunit TatA [Epidermidibacterium keratini]QHC02050.1 Sec-independent protein translocase subunit TatA [Epidermidibacterium keratini]
MNLGVPELIIIAIVLFALFGYKKLPDATRSIGRSLRIFKGEMQGMKDDDVKTRAEAQTVRAPLQNAPEPPVQNAPPAAAPQPQAAPQGRVADEPGEYRAS